MSTETMLTQLQHDLQQRYSQKYGDVRIQFDELIPQGDTSARFQLSISDSLGFITRYYGTAEYQGDRLQLKTLSI
ncbi:MAG TPA: hypothetical protein VED37_01995 [Ktedonobacteraceae bacterium]|nr:hypothetical protein [Ktedonobacteraceae bacterium]